MNADLRRALAIAAFVCIEALLVAFVDQPISNALRGLEERMPAFIDAFRFYTDLGKSKWYLWPAMLGIAYCAVMCRISSVTLRVRRIYVKTGKALVFLFAAVAGSGLVTDFIKPLLGRARPVEMQRESAYGFDPFTFQAAWNGMPSGHATTAFALAAVLCIYFPRQKVLWLALAFILAISRVMVNAHYLSDIVAGAAVGWCFTIGLRRLFNHNGNFPYSESIFPIDRNRGAS